MGIRSCGVSAELTPKAENCNSLVYFKFSRQGRYFMLVKFISIFFEGFRRIEYKIGLLLILNGKK